MEKAESEVHSSTQQEVVDVTDSDNDSDESASAADRNPEPPLELLERHLIDADNIGGTVFSKHWLFTTLMKLIGEVEGKGTGKKSLTSTSHKSAEADKCTDSPGFIPCSKDSNESEPSLCEKKTVSVDEQASPSKESPDGSDVESSDDEKACDLLDLDESLQDELCKLWDMSMNQEVVDFLLEFNAIEILTGVIAKSRSPRATEISVGILGNMACQHYACRKITSSTKLVGLMLLLLQSTDAPTLVEATRLLQVCLANPDTLNSWLEAIHSEPSVIHSITFILQSSTNTDLLKNVAAILDKLMDVDPEMCESWGDAVLVSAILEAIKQIQSVGSETYESFLHILQLVTTSEDGVQAMVDQADELCRITLDYLCHVCAEDIVAIEGREDATGSAVSILAAVFASWPNRDILLTQDVQLMRCLLKILEMVYLKYHNMQHRTGSSGMPSGGGEVGVIDLTEDEDVEKENGVTPEEKKNQKEAEKYCSKMIDMLYEVLQNFLLDIITALTELPLPNSDDSSNHNMSKEDPRDVSPDSDKAHACGDDASNESNVTSAESSDMNSLLVPKALTYLDTQCDHLRINYMVYIVKDFDGETASLIDSFYQTAVRWKKPRLARYIYLSHYRQEPPV